jgi:hypothetical protein
MSFFNGNAATRCSRSVSLCSSPASFVNASTSRIELSHKLTIWRVCCSLTVSPRREGIRLLSQALMETEVADLIGADRHKRTPDRTGHATATGCGPGTRAWARSNLAIPKVRPGTYFPSLLQPRRRAEHALLAVVQEA